MAKPDSQLILIRFDHLNKDGKDLCAMLSTRNSVWMLTFYLGASSAALMASQVVLASPKSILVLLCSKLANKLRLCSAVEDGGGLLLVEHRVYNVSIARSHATFHDNDLLALVCVDDGHAGNWTVMC